METAQVACLGLIFATAEERREHFLEILREKLKDPEFRKIEGVPIGSIEDILTLSDPPYYTACPIRSLRISLSTTVRPTIRVSPTAASHSRQT